MQIHNPANCCYLTVCVYVCVWVGEGGKGGKKKREMMFMLGTSVYGVLL